ncbi:butyrophilin-like protein 10 isoform X2 [Haplochromis burtoni]|uniref:Butyrophilin-like protein 10 n=1 Tax=Haplochromis burtoni TaxID=8153 RepID=A0A3Q2X478_HAPBU|nr:butyrophilin-like protein 10 isoform X2 [Haplochromis burtoni]
MVYCFKRIETQSVLECVSAGGGVAPSFFFFFLFKKRDAVTFDPQRVSADMELPPLLFLSFCFLTLSGRTFAAESGPPDSRVIVMEDNDVILPCSLSTNQNIEKELFVWKKEGTVPLKEVFMFDPSTYNKGQDDEFKGRVSHFPEQLKYGNASIRMNKTKLEDQGNYTCSFPVMQPSVKTSRIELVVGAASHPSVTNLEEEDHWALLECDVKNASPEPSVEWWDSKNQTILSEKPQVSKIGDRFSITLKATVKKTDRYRCVATQKEIYHQAQKQIYIRLSGDRSGTGMMRATIVSVIFGIIGIVVV